MIGNRRWRTGMWIVAIVTAGAASGLAQTPAASTPNAEPLRQVITVNGAEREYFIRLPKTFDSNRTYWLVLAAHGAGGNGRTFFLANGIHRYGDEQGFSVIVASPTFSAADGAAQQFPSLGEGAFLDAVVADVGRRYHVQSKFLLAGYSRGGQFSHRYCLEHPARVLACAPLAAGSWTTPDGRVLVQGIGELKDVAAANARTEELARELVTPRIAAAAWTKAAPGASAVPFLVMTGTLDPRNQVGRMFADVLKQSGFSVETAWPVTNHTPDAATRAEYERYAQETVRFFAAITSR